ncbi:MAG: glutathione S-transferase family protein [Pseudomonadota bacterium]
MKLLLAGPSPFVRKVLVVLEETGQSDAVERADVVAAPGGTAAELAAANPVGKIPALVRNDGPTLYDSRVICRFFDDRAGAGLYPARDPWATLTLEATGDGLMEAAVSMIYERRFRPAEIVSEDWIAAQWEKVARTLDALDSRWMGHLNGPLDIGQIAVGCALGYLDFRHADRDWRQGRDALARWYAAFAQRPSMQATIPADPK